MPHNKSEHDFQVRKDLREVKEDLQEVKKDLQEVKEDLLEVKEGVKKILQYFAVQVDHQSIHQAIIKEVPGALQQHTVQQAIQQTTCNAIYAIQQTSNNNLNQQSVQNTIQQDLQQVVLLAINQAIYQTEQRPPDQSYQQRPPDESSQQRHPDQSFQQRAPQQNERAHQGKQIVIFIYRTDSAQSCCPGFAEYLRGYINNQVNSAYVMNFLRRKPSIHVKEVSSMEQIDRDGTVLVCGYSSTVRLEAGDMFKFRKNITDSKSNLSLRVEFVIFRYGSDSSFLQLVDGDDNQTAVTAHQIFYEGGIILNEQTVCSIKAIYAAAI